MTILFKDTFTDVSGTLLTSHIPDISLNGNKWVGIAQPAGNSPTGSINASGQAIINQTVTGNNAGYYVNTGNSDGILTVTNVSVAGKALAIFRINPTDGSYFYVSSAGKLTFFDGGSIFTTLATITALSNGAIVKITFSGSSITVNVNGSNVAAVTNTNNQTMISHGLATGNTSVTFDDFTIEDLITGGTTTYTGSGTLQGTSNVSSVEKSILKALGTIQGSSSLTSSETYTTQTGTTYTGGGTLQGSSSLSVIEHYLSKASGTLQGISSLSSGETLILFTGNVYSASGIIQGSSNLTTSEKMFYSALGTISGYSVLTAHEIMTMVASGMSQGYSILSGTVSLPPEPVIYVFVESSMPIEKVRNTSVFMTKQRESSFNLTKERTSFMKRGR